MCCNKMSFNLLNTPKQKRVIPDGCCTCPAQNDPQSRQACSGWFFNYYIKDTDQQTIEEDKKIKKDISALDEQEADIDNQIDILRKQIRDLQEKRKIVSNIRAEIKYRHQGTLSKNKDTVEQRVCADCYYPLFKKEDTSNRVPSCLNE